MQLFKSVRYYGGGGVANLHRRHIFSAADMCRILADWGFDDKSMKFGMVVAKGILKNIRWRPTLKIQNGVHFSRWPPLHTK